MLRLTGVVEMLIFLIAHASLTGGYRQPRTEGVAGGLGIAKPSRTRDLGYK